MYCRSRWPTAGSSGNSSCIGRMIGTPDAAASTPAWYRYGISRILRWVKVRVTSTASSSKIHGTRYEVEPWKRLWLPSSPNAVQRLKTAASGVPSKPPMSWLQCANPLSASDRPPRSVSAIDANVEVESPPQCTGML